MAQWEEAFKNGDLATNESIVEEYQRNNAAPEFTGALLFSTRHLKLRGIGMRQLGECLTVRFFPRRADEIRWSSA